MPVAATYISATQFAVASDVTAKFVPGLRVCADCGDDDLRKGSVAGSIYDAATSRTLVTLELDAGVLTDGLTSVAHGYDTPDSLARATTDRHGAVRLATAAEAVDGTDTSTAVTPAGVAAALANTAGLSDLGAQVTAAAAQATLAASTANDAAAVAAARADTTIAAVNTVLETAEDIRPVVDLANSIPVTFGSEEAAAGATVMEGLQAIALAGEDGLLPYRRDDSADADYITTNNGQAKWVPSLPLPYYARRVFYARDPAFRIRGDGDGLGGGTDDTAAIAAAISGLESGETLVFTRHPKTGNIYYNVTHLLLDSVTNLYSTVKFDHGVRLYGMSTVSAPGVVELRGCQKMNFINLQIETDGTRDSPLYALHYDCLLRMRPQVAGVDGYTKNNPCQFLNFVGGQLRNARRGIIFGELENEEARERISFTDTAAVIFQRFDFAGINGAIVMNARNSYVEFAQCRIVAQKTACGTWWNDDDGFLLKSLEGTLIITGGMLQRAIATGFALYGKEILINGTTCEWASPSYFTGRIDIMSPADCYYGPQTGTFAKIAPDARGRLRIEGQWEKNNYTAGGTDGLFVDATQAPDYDYSLDVELIDWKFGYPNYCVVGGRPHIKRLDIRDDVDTDGMVENTFVPANNCWSRAVASPDGEGMSTTLDASTKLGWSQLIGVADNLQFGRYTESPPNGCSASIVFLQLNALVWMATPAGTAGHLITDHQSVLAIKLKCISQTDFFGIKASFYDISGTLISTSNDLLGLDTTLITKFNVAVWQQFFIPLQAPVGSRYLRIIFRGPTTGVCGMALSDMRLI